MQLNDAIADFLRYAKSERIHPLKRAALMQGVLACFVYAGLRSFECLALKLQDTDVTEEGGYRLLIAHLSTLAAHTPVLFAKEGDAEQMPKKSLLNTGDVGVVETRS